MTWPAMKAMDEAPTDGTRILLAWEHLPHPVVGYYGKHGHAANRWMAQTAPSQSAARPLSPPLGWWPLPARTKPAALPKDIHCDCGMCQECWDRAAQEDMSRQERAALPKEGEEALARRFYEAAFAGDGSSRMTWEEAQDPCAPYVADLRTFARIALSSLPVSGEVDQAAVIRRAEAAEADWQAASAEAERLRKALDSIACGGTYSIKLFESRMRGKKSLTWHAVNVLQEGLAAAQGTAQAALEVTPQQATEER